MLQTIDTANDFLNNRKMARQTKANYVKIINPYVDWLDYKFNTRPN